MCLLMLLFPGSAGAQGWEERLGKGGRTFNQFIKDLVALNALLG